MTTIDDALLSHAGRSALWPSGATLLVAVSGGPDSLCLLHAAWRLQGHLNLGGVCAAHVDHGLRGDDSAGDAEFVAAFCATRSIPYLSCRLDIAAEAAKHHISIQDAARQARYAFLEDAADTSGANVIATAHTRDDQAETVLLNILRGTGIAGLAGIPEKRSRIIRPLLDVSRLEIERYCQEHSLTPRLDASNTDPDHYLRNRVRLELLPLLDRTYHPGVRESLLRLSRLAAQDSDYLEDVARGEFERMRTRRDDNTIRLERATLRALPRAIASRVIRLAFAVIRGTDEGLSESHIDKALALALEDVPGSVTSPTPACVVCCRGEWLEFGKPIDAEEYQAVRVPLPVPGLAHSEEDGWTVETSAIMTVSRAAHEPAAQGGNIGARINAEAIDVATLHIRYWQRGDRIDPLGMEGRKKKLQDIFGDAKISRDRRHRWPIVCDSHGPVWIPGLTLAERVKMTAETQALLSISATMAE